MSDKLNVTVKSIEETDVGGMSALRITLSVGEGEVVGIVKGTRAESTIKETPDDVFLHRDGVKDLLLQAATDWWEAFGDWETQITDYGEKKTDNII